MRGGLTDRWRVVESIPAAGSGRCGLVGVSDGADAALRHALQDPENVESWCWSLPPPYGPPTPPAMPTTTLQNSKRV